MYLTESAINLTSIIKNVLSEFNRDFPKFLIHGIPKLIFSPYGGKYFSLNYKLT